MLAYTALLLSSLTPETMPPGAIDCRITSVELHRELKDAEEDSAITAQLLKRTIKYSTRVESLTPVVKGKLDEDLFFMYSLHASALLGMYAHDVDKQKENHLSAARTVLENGRTRLAQVITEVSKGDRGVVLEVDSRLKTCIATVDHVSQIYREKKSAKPKVETGPIVVAQSTPDLVPQREGLIGRLVPLVGFGYGSASLDRAEGSSRYDGVGFDVYVRASYDFRHKRAKKAAFGTLSMGPSYEFLSYFGNDEGEARHMIVAAHTVAARLGVGVTFSKARALSLYVEPILGLRFNKYLGMPDAYIFGFVVGGNLRVCLLHETVCAVLQGSNEPFGHSAARPTFRVFIAFGVPRRVLK